MTKEQNERFQEIKKFVLNKDCFGSCCHGTETVLELILMIEPVIPKTEAILRRELNAEIET